MENKTLTFAEKVAINKQKGIEAATPELKGWYKKLQSKVEGMRKAVNDEKSEFFDYLNVDGLSEKDRLALVNRLHREYPEEAPFINSKTMEISHFVMNEEYTQPMNTIAFQY